MDGVILDYHDGWQGFNVFGKPVPGAVEGIKELRAAGWRVIIFTSRMLTPELKSYLNRYEIEPDGINTTEFNPPNTSQKPVGDVYVDDRAWPWMRHFDAKAWEELVNDLISMIGKERGYWKLKGI
jgi:hypothetical protein